jgi:3-methylcrotonyl-CoA carboxylase alpha subunit
VVAAITGGAVTVEGQGPAPGAVAIEAGDAIYVVHHGTQTKVARRDFAAAAAHGEGSGLIRAPMHGKVLAVFVDEGAAVHRGQRLAILEAMKMEHTLAAPFDGTVTKVAVAPNSQVAEGATIMTIEESNG